jgi:hypothetical protein
MKRLIIGLAFILTAVFAAPVPARAGVEAGVSLGSEGVEGFYLSVGEYFHVPKSKVMAVKKRRIPDEELPVVFFLAARAGVAHSKIVDLRRGGMSWLDITLRFGLTPEVFYVPVKAGPPYGKAYGYYMKKPRKEWKKLVFKDREVIDLVNLSFITEHHGYSAGEVIRLRRGGSSFIVIHGKAKKAKKGKGKGKGKDKAKGKGK